ncbi:MAG: hypothetical protein ACT452_16335 [Microthrixaceae bacterium]
MNLAVAIDWATRAHADATDKAGRPYIEHPLRVMEAIRADEQRLGDLINEPSRVEQPRVQIVLMAAVLHDVLEDSDVALDELRSAGCPEAVCGALLALTRRRGESYDDYLARAAADPIARRVKFADIDDNSDPSRLRLLPTSQAETLERKYQHARELLRAWALYWQVVEERDQTPNGFYRYFLNDHQPHLLIRQWNGASRGGMNWPECLRPDRGGGHWVPGPAYLLNAITGLGDDPYSQGDWCTDLSEEQARDIADERGLDLDAARLTPSGDIS